jgi:hypothetical protein
MTQQHPITPPPELVRQWSTASPIQYNDQDWTYELFIAHHAAQWGADQELEACCQALYDRYDSVRHATGFPGSDMSDWLRAARRPKPPSLKEQALDELHISFDRGYLKEGAADTIRRALEQLPDHE